MRKIKFLLCYICSIFLVFCLNGCSLGQTFKNEKRGANIMVLKGPSGIGMLDLVQKTDSENNLKYDINIVNDPAFIFSKLINNEIDIAALPTNMAANLFNKTKDIKMLAINTLGMLYIVSKNKIENINELKGKTLYLAGKEAVPDYILRDLLKKNGLVLGKDIFLEYKSQHEEVVALLAADKIKIALLPEPFATQLVEKYPEFKISLDINKIWEQINEERALLAMGCLVAKKDFIEQNPELLKEFLQDYKNSTEVINKNPKNFGELCLKYGFMEKDIAQKAIPRCNIVFIENQKMQSIADKFFQILYKFNPKSIGGLLPGEEFYYKG